MSRKKTYDEFIDEMKVKHPDIEVLSKEYNGNKEKVQCKCLVDGNVWWARPDNLLNGAGCRVCGDIRTRDRSRVSKEEFLRRVSDTNSNLELISEYVDTHTKVKMRCNTDGYEWNVIPSDIFEGKHCPRCSKRERKTTERFVYEMAIINPNIEVIGKYVNSSTKIHCKCKVDGFEWDASGNSLLMGHGCPMCANNAKRSLEQFVADMLLINPDIEIIGKYIDTETKISCRCKKDGYIWSAMPSNLLRGTGCPKCNTYRGEKAINNWLTLNNYKFEYQYRFEDCKNKRSLPFDFYLPYNNIAIEYDGKQHTSPVNFGGMSDSHAIKCHDDCVKNDNIKTNYCKKHNIKLIRISYTDFNNIEKILDKQLL